MEKEIISIIDKLLEQYKENPIYRKDLKFLRNKYIYKEIGLTEMKKDIQFLKNLNKIHLDV